MKLLHGNKDLKSFCKNYGDPSEFNELRFNSNKNNFKNLIGNTVYTLEQRYFNKKAIK